MTTQSLVVAAAVGAAAVGGFVDPSPSYAQITPVTLQWFETSWRTMEDRTADAFIAGYGRVWTPPISKSDSGGSIGYNVFDRFDLGGASSPTRYGTRDQFGAVVNEQDKADIATFVDLILNHNSFADNSTPGFEASGDYPGFVISYGGDPYGDFHDPSASGDWDVRVAGLIDIAQEKNHVMIRHPVSAGDPNNIPAGTIYDKPDPDNYQFYSDTGLPANAIGIHPFNLADPMAGDPVAENATGLLLRHVRWILEVIGVDGFRIDAGKHIPDWFFRNYYDAHVWERGGTDLAGSPITPFCFLEVFDGDLGKLSSYVCKNGTGNCNTSGGVQGNRDVLDFPLYFAMKSELNGSGFGTWYNIVNASVDQIFDSNANDGDFGVQFVEGHDASTDAPVANNLAYCYTLMRAGSPLVYFQAGEFGSVSFPRPGRGDALGGQYGTIITSLVDVHNEYARGDYIERWIDNDVLVFERNNACLVGINDRYDGGYDQRTVQTNFAEGLRLKELTGNAADPTVDPYGNIDDVLTVGAGGSVTIHVPRNKNTDNVQHDKGYVVYGPFNPDGELIISDVAATIPPDPGTEPNGTRRLAEIKVIQADQFEVRLETTDADATDPNEDDFAMLRLDAGVDLNGNGYVDVTDSSEVSYGFEEFLTEADPLEYGGQFIGGQWKGVYRQTVDATQLSEGRHYLTVIAFRTRPGGSPSILETWRDVLYIDRTPAAIEKLAPADGEIITSSAYDFQVRSIDGTVSALHMFLDYPPDTDFVTLAQNGQGRMDQDDRYSFSKILTGIESGYHRIDFVVFEESGRAAVISFTGVRAIINGEDGLGDLNDDGVVNNFDVKPFASVRNAGGFDPRADINGDGLVDSLDDDAFMAMLTGGGS